MVLNGRHSRLTVRDLVTFSVVVVVKKTGDKLKKDFYMLMEKDSRVRSRRIIMIWVTTPVFEPSITRIPTDGEGIVIGDHFD